MAIVQGPFERIAETVTERTAELLCTEVSVVDSYGRIVTSSDSGLLGIHVDLDDTTSHNYVRVPLRLDTQCGDVIIAEPRTGEIISPRLARVLTELVINQTAVVDRLPNKNELKNKFIHDLLHGEIGDEAVILREAQIMGMDLAPPRVVLLIDAADYILAPSGNGHLDPSDARIRRRTQLVIGRVVDFFELPNDTICAYIGDGEVAVLKASNRKNLGTWVDEAKEPDQMNPSWANLSALKRASEALLSRLRSDTRASISIGIGRYHAGLWGLSYSYQDALAALKLGRRFHGQNQVHCLDRLGIAAFVGVSDERTKIDLARYLLSPLDQEQGLLTTLDAYFANHCSPSETATVLSIHRNTLSYRLDKIASLTGLDPRHFDDAVQIRLALVLRSLPAEPRSGPAQTSMGSGQHRAWQPGAGLTEGQRFGDVKYGTR